MGLLATAHLKYDIIVKTLLVHMQLMCLHMPYLSVHALERSLVHTSVFLHKFIMCASLCLPSSLLLIQHSTILLYLPQISLGWRFCSVCLLSPSLFAPEDLDRASGSFPLWTVIQSAIMRFQVIFYFTFTPLVNEKISCRYRYHTQKLEVLFVVLHGVRVLPPHEWVGLS